MPTKILAIDDSKTMRLAIKITFAAEDADVTSVSKGSEAVARAKQMGADVVLIDASLAPGEPSGYDVCRALKQDPATAGIPVIVLVSNQTGPDEAQLAAAGGDGWIGKPFDTQELIDKVAAVQGSAVARPTAAAARPAAAPVAAPPPVVAPVADTDDDASSSQSGKRLRPQNRTQMGMPSPAAAARQPVAPAPAVASRPAVTKPTSAPVTQKPVAPAPSPRAAARPAVAAAPQRTAPAKPQRPARAAPAAAGIARPGASAGGPIPIAIPIPFTSADAPTASMVERLRQAAAVGEVDPRVAEMVASLSREVLEAIAWEVVPYLAESIIRERAESA